MKTLTAQGVAYLAEQAALRARPGVHLNAQALASEAEESLLAGGPPMVELKAHQTASGHVETIDVPAEYVWDDGC